MAEGKITITILGGGNGTGDGGGGGEDKEKDPSQIVLNSLNKIVHPVQTAKNAVKEGAIESLGGGGGAVAVVGGGLKLLSDALSTAYSVAMMEHNRYFTLREDYLAQNKMNMIQSQISTTKTMLSSIGSNALQYGAIGMAAGPVGAVVGAAVGAVIGGVKSGISLATERDQKIEQYNMQLNATNAQTSFMASRASLVNGGRGTEN